MGGKTILFVLENYFPHVGGVEILFKNLCEGLVKKGHVINIVTHRLKDSLEYEVINGVNIHRVNCLHSRYLFTFMSIPKILKVARDADIIHTTIFTAAPPAWLCSKLLRKKCILHVMEVWIDKWNVLTDMPKFKAGIHNFLEKCIYMLPFNEYITISGSTQKQLLDIGIHEEKTTIIYPGVDYNHWNPKKYDGDKIRTQLGIKNEFVYLFTGRPGVSKGLKYFLCAKPLIQAKLKNSIAVCIVSNDIAYKHLREKIELGIRLYGGIILLDPVDYNDLPNYVKMADCVVVPSLAEGFGYTTAEACAMGKPVVGSNVGSIPEVISGKYILTKPKNECSIARGVLDVVKKDYKKTKLKKFTTTKLINRTITLYNRMLK